jgi:hypothetical protein
MADVAAPVIHQLKVRLRGTPAMIWRGIVYFLNL